MNNSSTLLYQTQQIKELEQLAINEQHLSITSLMQRAGKAAWVALQKKWFDARRIVVLCGKGNNAGDGYVLAKLAHEAGLQVVVLNVVAIDKLFGAAKEAAAACQEAGVVIADFSPEYLHQADVIVDALLGTGLVGAANDDFAHVITEANAAGCPILALDLPSGLEADTGNVARIAIKADLTITFIARKCGLYTGYARECCGEIVCDDLEVAQSLFYKVKPLAKILTLEELRPKLVRRSRIAHKGDFGHVLVVGGNFGMGGAVRMAAEAAVRVGAGLVSVATRKEHVCAINAARPELMCHGVDSGNCLQPLLEKASVIVLGPGLGQDEWAKMILEQVLNCQLPLVVDADALNLIAERFEVAAYNFYRDNWILTPHPGEAARLLGQTTATVQANRFTALAALQNKFAGVCVLKGAGTLITAASNNGDDCIGVCTAGNPGMASGGMGDILSGIIGGLVAQRLRLVDAAQLGVCAHSCAADIAVKARGEFGLLAMDLLPYVRQLLSAVV